MVPLYCDKKPLNVGKWNNFRLEALLIEALVPFMKTLHSILYAHMGTKSQVVLQARVVGTGTIDVTLLHLGHLFYGFSTGNSLDSRDEIKQHDRGRFAYVVDAVGDSLW